MLSCCHLTSAHPRYDTRIFHKICSSLAAAGYKVYLVVADGRGAESINNIEIIDVGNPAGRLYRMTKTVYSVYKSACLLDCDVYHLHDPELLPVGLFLKKRGKKVIFDSHEDVPKQILGKPYLGWMSAWFLSNVFLHFEQWICRRMDFIVSATPVIHEKFLKINCKSVNVNNFPILDELNTDHPWAEKLDEVVYVGGISRIRGVIELVDAMSHTSVSARLNLCGMLINSDVEDICRNSLGWKKVNEMGYLDRSGVRFVLSKSIAGLVTLHPLINYVESYPVKMFEYMAAGIPVIASDFPLWREILESSNCGICVNPNDPVSIAAAIDYLISNRDVAQKMGENARIVIEKKFNWSIEVKKLLSMYTAL